MVELGIHSSAVVEAANGPAALVLYDVTTRHVERPDEDELRTVGVSKEHRVRPNSPTRPRSTGPASWPA